MTLNHSDEIPRKRQNNFFIIVESESDSVSCRREIFLYNKLRFSDVCGLQTISTFFFIYERDNVIKRMRNKNKRFNLSLYTVWL